MRLKELLKGVFRIFGLFLFIYVILFSLEKELRQMVHDDLDVNLKKVVSVEYGSDFDAREMVEDYSGNLKIDGEVDTGEVGSYPVSFTVSDTESLFGNSTAKTYEREYRVVDTAYPVIELESEEVTIYSNSGYDLSTDNILSVSDPVDGELPPESITVSFDGDLKKAGNYTVTITATDRNGLSTSESYKLNVKWRITGRTPQNYYVIYNYLTDVFGFNRAAACGILANIKFECNFDPTAAGTTFYGLCQWGYARRERLGSWCAANGYAYDSIEGQLQFMYHELSNGYTKVKNYLYNVEDSAQGAYDAATYFCNRYEGAATDAGRGDLAYYYYSN